MESIRKFRNTDSEVDVLGEVEQSKIDSLKVDAQKVLDEVVTEPGSWLERWANYILDLGDEGEVVWAYVTPTDFGGSPFSPGKNAVNLSDVV